MMIRVGIVGASGYTGVELARLLANCPDVKLTVATSRQYDGRNLAEVYPNLAGLVDVVCEDLAVNDLVDKADLFFTAVPHQTAMSAKKLSICRLISGCMMPRFMNNGTRPIALSSIYQKPFTDCLNYIVNR
jgi:N-acetyl-gamma-glutamylphosphate reductase